MAYASAEGGGYGVDASVIHFDPAHPDHINVPDAELLFRGEYQRLGPDLVLTGPDGRHHIVPGYFSGEAHPALVAPNGASLTPDVIELLAGSPTPGQYAQAQPTTPPDAIGKCEKVIGSVTVVRNGVAVALHVGDAVYKSDVVQTGANSSAGIGFPDGTALNLVANTRMALNDYSFDASGTSNSALFTLVEGTFAFVAGKVAHDGNMKVSTPVATMGIRGTTVYFATVTSSLGEVQYLAQLFADYQTGHVGAVDWYDNNPASPTYGQVIDSITDTGYSHYFTPRLGQAPNVAVLQATALQLDQQMSLINDLFRVLQLINNGNQTTTPNSGSSTLPDIDVPHVFQPNNGGGNFGPFTFNFSIPGLTVPTVVEFVIVATTTQLPTTQTQHQSNPTPPPSGTIPWTSPSSGPWNTGGNWGGGNVPGGTNNVQIALPIIVTVDDTQSAGNLVLGAGAKLFITGDGTLTLTKGLSDAGVVEVGGGDPPMLTVNGPVTIQPFALLEAFGEGTQINLTNVTLSNLGIIEAAEDATIAISLKADSSNSGTIEAFVGGIITLNENGHNFSNQGLIEASDGGGISIVGGVTNSEGANIEAIGPNATIDISNGTVDNQGGARIEASHRGAITFDGETVTNELGAKIEATHLGTINFDGGPVTNDSTIEAKHYGVIAFSSDGVTNNSDAEIEAKDHGVITFDGVGLSNEAGATIDAKDYGSITFTQTEGGPGGIENAGTIEAKNHSTVTFQDIGGDNNGGITNNGGTIAAVGLGAVVNFEHSSIIGGNLNADGGALFVDAASTLTGSVSVSIGGGGFADFANVVNANGANVSVAFASMGTLELDQAPASPISVSGFGLGDAIDLTNVEFNAGCGTVTAFWSEGTLTVSNGPQTETFAIEGSGNVVVAPDAFGGTEVFFGDDVWTNTAGGDWTQTDRSNWNNGNGHVPNPSTDAVIGVSGVYTVTIVPVGNDESREVKTGSLAITDAGATLTGSGTLTVETTLDNAGTINATGCDVLYINTDTLINEYSGVIAALNNGNLVIADQSDSENYGLIKAANGGSLTITHDGTATNEHGATIEAVNNGDLTLNNNLADANYGLMKSAGDGSTITINVDNVDPSDGQVAGGNFSKMEAVNGGDFSIVGDMFNASGATMKAVGEGSQFKFLNADYEEGATGVGNAGTIFAADHGAVTFCGVAVDNQDGGVIAATDYGTVTFKFGSVDNEVGATIVAQDYGTVTFDHVSTDGGLTNLGMVEAFGWGSLVSIEHSTVTGGTLTADGGTILIGCDSTLNGVSVVITDGGIAKFGDVLTQGVTFAGAGTLTLEQAPGEGAAATGFGVNDVLDFTNIAWSNGPTPSWVENEQQTAGILTITYDVVDGCVTQSYSESITLNGNYSPNAFTVLSDPSGGTEVVYGTQQTWTGGTSNQWNTASNWSNGVVPGTTDTVFIDNAGLHQPVTITDSEQVANLVIGQGASLELDSGGLLTVTNALDDAGTIDVNATGTDPFLLIDGPVRVESDAEIISEGSHGATVEFFNDQVGNAGSINANGQGSVLFEGSAVDNQNGGVIEATTLSVVTFDNATVDNHGGGTIEADGGTVVFENSTITNDEDEHPATIEATEGGTVSFIGSSVTGSDGVIQADEGSVVKLAGSTIDGGDIRGEGTLEVSGSSTLKGSADVHIGQINVEDGVTLTADGITIDGSTINLGHTATGNAAAFTEISVPDVNSIGPAVSADGEFVAFITSSNLPGQGDNQSGAIELYDAATGKLTDISAAAPALPAGETSLGFTNVPSISADGRYVVFEEKYDAPNNQGPATETSEVLLYDRESQTATVVQTNAGHAEISGNGQYVVMQGNPSPGSDSALGETVLVTDRAGNVLTTISGDPTYEPPEGPNPFGNIGSVYEPDISSDGRFVTFWTTASQIEINNNLVQTGNGTGNAEVYVYDRGSGALKMVSAAGGTPGDGDSGTTTLADNQDSSWPSSMSADGHYVVFQSSADNLVNGVGDANHDVSNIFLYDTQTGTITAITHSDGSSITGDSIRAEISTDGTTVTFASDESDLPGATDANGVSQTYVYDTLTQKIELVSGVDGTPANAESDLGSAVSGNGSAIAFGSLADNLVTSTANDGSANIYLAAPGTIDVIGDSTIKGHAVVNDGTAIVENGVTLTFDGATLNGTFVQVNANATLDVEGCGATFAGAEIANLGNIIVDQNEAGAILTLASGATVTGGTMSIDASEGGELFVDSAAGATLNNVSVVGIGGSSSIGQVETAAHSTLALTGGTIMSSIDLQIDSCGKVVIDGIANTLGAEFDSVAVNNNGILEVNGATLFADSDSSFSGSGYLAITGGGLAHFAGEFQQNTTFLGAGTLELGDSLADGGYAGLIRGFGSGDSVDLNDVAYSSGEYAVWTQVTCGADAGGTLQIFKTCDSEGVLEETLNVVGTYTQNEFYLADDGTAAHGTSVYSSAISFNDGQTNFSNNADPPNDYTGPHVSVDGREITLTNDLQAEYGSWFTNNTHSVAAFTASFDYQAEGGGDGLAFILQNDPRGSGALGTDFAENGGSGLAYTGISPSAAVEFNFYNGHVVGTNFETNGTTQIYNPTGDVPLGTGDNIQVVLSYDGSVLTETLTDLTDGATYSTSYTGINLSQIVGSDSAYIGFSASTGAGTSTQSVSNFDFENGQAVHWVGPNGADWTASGVWNDANGNTAGTPNLANDVFIDEQGSYTLTITSADTANLLTIAAAGAGADVQDENGGSLTLNGSLTIDAGSFSLIGGALSAASIDVEANGHFIGYGCVSAPLYNDGGFVEAQQHLSLLAAVTGNGSFQIDNGAVLEFGESVAGGTVTFGSESGTLKLDDPSGFNGVVAGISGENDVIDLAGFNSSTTVATPGEYNSENNTTSLLVSDGDHSVTLTLAGNLSDTSWSAESAPGGVAIFDPPAVDVAATANGASGKITFADASADTLTASVTPQGSDYVGTLTLDPLTKNDGAASLGFHFDLGNDQINLAPGQTLTQSYGINITDAQNPALNVHQTVAVSIGGAGNDNFVFHPGVGADTIIGFNPTQDTIELDQFANAQTVQQLESLITSDAHGDAVIALGHHDSITVAGVTAQHLQQAAQSGHVILH